MVPARIVSPFSFVFFFCVMRLPTEPVVREKPYSFIFYLRPFFALDIRFDFDGWFLFWTVSVRGRDTRIWEIHYNGTTTDIRYGGVGVCRILSKRGDTAVFTRCNHVMH